MTTITMLEFRRNAEKIVRRAQRGERMVLTYRGKPVMRLEPINDQAPEADDPFYKLDRLADGKGKNLTNSEMDEIIYDR